MGKERKTIRVSSSVSNFRAKLLTRTGLPLGWGFGHTIFFGLYHPGDYVRFLLHRGRRTVVWCGSDILALRTSRWRWLIAHLPARHICENLAEWVALGALGIDAAIHPMLFDPAPVEPCFTPSKTPHVYLNAHPGRYVEYGVTTVTKIAPKCPAVTFHIYGMTGENRRNVKFHGIVSNEQFNEEIKHYHAALRLNDFDGFSEIVAKSILFGQYPITYIPYPYIDCYESEAQLITLLCNLRHKQESNPASHWWKERLAQSLQAVLA